MPSVIQTLQSAQQRLQPTGTQSPAAQALGLSGAGDVVAQQLQTQLKQRKKNQSALNPVAFGDTALNAARSLFGGN